MSDANSRPETDVTGFLERYPHLSTCLASWGTLACRRVLMGLMNDTRNGQRKGFPAQDALTVFRLLQEHDNKFPQFDDSSDSPCWIDASQTRTYWKA
ncbi:MAG: hypothetical protein RBS40_08395 [Rhodocyclaceae bacterium]|jgi:hypothetical protein|nr:hypothetical protein [Rhodocyclaceae bacterium]